ncbi:MAG: hypothetical protein Q9174_001297 [Haloplaca sp. 1 TL-2023]
MSSPPHPLFHFGMAGWWKIKNEETAYYKPDKKRDDGDWPPKYWKFALETAEEPKSEHAFVDFRRFARIRLVDCAAEEMRNTSPLKENGPDPVQDGITEEWLVQKLQSKHVPVKALLLDQANISGIGNWVGDELLYDARIHPEQYSNTLTASQMKQLHKSMMYVCKTSVELRAESDKFPETWLFKHRWGKGKKDDPQKLPNGEKIKFVTVGGRTSAIIPSVQKKTGTVAADVDGSDSAADEGKDDDEENPKKRKRSTKTAKNESNEGDDEGAVAGAPDKKRPTGKKRGAVKAEQDETKAEVDGDDDDETKKGRRTTKKSKKESASEDKTSTITDTIEAKPQKGKKRAAPKEEQFDTKPAVNDQPPAKKQANGKAKVKAEANGASDIAEDTKPTKTPRTQKAVPSKTASKKQTDASGRRRSARVSNGVK